MERAESVERKPGDHAVTLLVVGSEAEDLFRLRSICGGTGWRLHEVPTLRAAVAHLEHNAIPVVLCQRHLPDGDWTALRDAAYRLREPPHLIVWSHHAANSLGAEVLNLGGHDVLAAPFRVVEVVYAVSAAVRKWRQQGSSAARLQQQVPAA
jgi:DNA-binding response OmpR family regulator